MKPNERDKAQDEHFQAMIYAEYRNMCPDTDRIVVSYRHELTDERDATIASLRAEVDRLREALRHAEVRLGLDHHPELIIYDIRAALASSPKEPERVRSSMYPQLVNVNEKMVVKYIRDGEEYYREFTGGRWGSEFLAKEGAGI
jgi:hypothetical protein